ncbi:MAG: hypothetical protein ACRCV9_17645 [Burkholderiaceae bacterium]
MTAEDMIADRAEAFGRMIQSTRTLSTAFADLNEPVTALPMRAKGVPANVRSKHIACKLLAEIGGEFDDE